MCYPSCRIDLLPIIPVAQARRDYEQAVAAFKQALLHNPNFANAHAELGRTMIDVGRPRETAAHVDKAVAISPTDFALYIWCSWAGLAALYADEPKAALDWLRKSHQANRAHDNTLWLLAVALAHDNRKAEARAKMDEFLRLRPNATLDDWTRRESWTHPAIAEQRERIRATLMQLGVPEGKLQAASTPR